MTRAQYLEKGHRRRATLSFEVCASYRQEDCGEMLIGKLSTKTILHAQTAIEYHYESSTHHKRP